jgi:hypothetical protein
MIFEVARRYIEHDTATYACTDVFCFVVLHCLNSWLRGRRLTASRRSPLEHSSALYVPATITTNTVANHLHIALRALLL